MSGLLLNEKSLDSRQEEIKHIKNRSSCHPLPGHPAPVLLRIESQLPLPREGEFVWFYHLTGAEVNTWLQRRLHLKCKVPYKPRGLGLRLPSTPPHWLHCHAGSEGTTLQPSQSRKLGTCYREGSCLTLTHCNTWRLTVPSESISQFCMFLLLLCFQASLLSHQCYFAAHHHSHL